MTTFANKRSYAIGVLVENQAFQLASRFITVDTDAAPQSINSHTATVVCNFEKQYKALIMRKLIILFAYFFISFNLYSQSIFDAIENKDYDKIESLLQKKSKIDKTNSDGITPLWKATLMNDTISMIILLKNGANPNAPTDGGTTPIFLSCNDGHVESAIILCRYGANVNFNKNKYNLSPLRHAARSGSIEVVKFLINQGAEINAKAADNGTALSAASLKGHIDIVKLLIQHGATIDIIDKDGESPLMNASSEGRTEIVRYLLEKGANKTFKNKKGKTAIDLAKEKGFPQIVELLK